MKKISLAIPTYLSSKYVSILLRSIEKSEIINEVIISDDSSNVAENRKIEKILNKFKKSNSSIQFKLFQNSDNLGAFNNKFNAINLCANDIVYQIDSDNIASKNIDFTLTKVLENLMNVFHQTLLEAKQYLNFA